MKGYNDDLVMSLGICLWIRDTALRLRAEGIHYKKSQWNILIKINQFIHLNHLCSKNNGK